MNIFLSISINICFECSKELIHWDGSFEYPQHIFWLRNRKIIYRILSDLDMALCRQVDVLSKSIFVSIVSIHV